MSGVEHPTIADALRRLDTLEQENATLKACVVMSQKRSINAVVQEIENWIANEVKDPTLKKSVAEAHIKTAVETLTSFFNQKREVIAIYTSIFKDLMPMLDSIKRKM